jgi:hypothetical protein
VRAWLLVAVVVVVLVVAGGGTVVVVKSRAEFLRLIEAEVRRQLEELRPDLSPEARARAARIVAAQAALESGYGATKAFREGFNFGNVSAGSSWKGPTIAGGDLEYDAAGKAKKITQAWRKYPSLAAAVSDFFTLLSWSRYQRARDALLRGDADAYAAELRRGGYFTAPLAEYQAGVASALKGFA